MIRRPKLTKADTARTFQALGRLKVGGSVLIRDVPGEDKTGTQSRLVAAARAWASREGVGLVFRAVNGGARAWRVS